MLHRLFPRAWRWAIKRRLGLDRCPAHPELNEIDFTVGSRVVLDVGAFVGNFAANLLLRAPLTEIHCFEPNPDVFPRLEATCRRMGKNAGRPRCQAWPQAVGAGAGTAELSLTQFPPANSLLPISEASREGWKEVDFTTNRRVCVPVTTIAAHAEEHRLQEVKLLKMDVQGYELEVLRGCGDMLEKIEYVFAEVQFTPLYVGAPVWTEIVDYLHGHAFRPELMGGFCVSPEGQLLQADLLFRNCRLGRE